MPISETIHVTQEFKGLAEVILSMAQRIDAEVQVEHDTDFDCLVVKCPKAFDGYYSIFRKVESKVVENLIANDSIGTLTLLTITRVYGNDTDTETTIATSPDEFNTSFKVMEDIARHILWNAGQQAK